MKYEVFEDNLKSHEPEKVLQAWFGVNWQRKFDRMNPQSRGYIFSLNKPAKNLKIYRTI